MGAIRMAMMLTTLIMGLIAGPAVSLFGSPTVSPVTAAACVSVPLPPRLPSSMYFLALSQAPPPEVIWMARKSPVTMLPISMPPRAVAKDEADQDRRHNRNQAGQDHLPLGRARHQVHGPSVFRRGRPL